MENYRKLRAILHALATDAHQGYDALVMWSRVPTSYHWGVFISSPVEILRQISETDL